MSEFSFDGFDRGPQSLFLIRGEILRFSLGVDVEKDDRLMQGKSTPTKPLPEPLRCPERSSSVKTAQRTASRQNINSGKTRPGIPL